MHYFGDNLTHIGKEKLIGYYEKNIKKLEEENKKLKELIDEFENKDSFASKQISFIEKYFISKQKIKDRIEELKKESNNTYIVFLEKNRLDEKLHYKGIMLDSKIEVLEELLNREGK